MRIGNIMIDTGNMTIEELSTIIRELRNIRCRKEQAQEFENRMCDLLREAQENGFSYIDKDYGNIWRFEEFELYDERA